MLLPKISQIENLKEQVKFLQEDVESLNKDHEDYEQHFDDIYMALAQLAAKNKEANNKSRKTIGFIRNEK